MNPRLEHYKGANAMKVREIMTSHVTTCRPETNLAEVVTLMWEQDCGVLPVVKRRVWSAAQEHF